MKRVPLCSVRGCPAKSSPDYHVPFCGHGLEGQHHHSKKRSQGGHDSFQVFICPDCHDAIDNKHTLKDMVYYLPALEQWRYAIWRPGRQYRGEPKYLCDKTIDPPFWEDGYDEEKPSEGLRGNSNGSKDSHSSKVVVATRLGDKPLRPGHPTSDETYADVQGVPAGSGQDRTASSDTLTFAEWAEKCKSIGTFRHSLGFHIGDLVILGEDNFGEKAWQELSELGYEDRSIGNMVRVCRAIPPARRRDTLTYSHHVVVYQLPEAEQDTWLDQAEGLTAKAFRELVHGVKEPPVYRCPECGHQAELKEFKSGN